MSACAVLAAVVLVTTPPATLDLPSREQAPQPDLRPRLVVEDSTQLPRLMKGDPAFAEQAKALEDRRTAAWVAGGLGVVAMLGFTFASVSSLGNGDPNPAKAESQGADASMYALAGLASFAAGCLVAALVHPKRGEVIDLVNGWNLAHPDQPLEVQPILVVPAYTELPGPGPVFATRDGA